MSVTTGVYISAFAKTNLRRCRVLRGTHASCQSMAGTRCLAAWRLQLSFGHIYSRETNPPLHLQPARVDAHLTLSPDSIRCSASSEVTPSSELRAKVAEPDGLRLHHNTFGLQKLLEVATQSAFSTRRSPSCSQSRFSPSIILVCIMHYTRGYNRLLALVLSKKNLLRSPLLSRCASRTYTHDTTCSERRTTSVSQGRQ